MRASGRWRACRSPNRGSAAIKRKHRKGKLAADHALLQALRAETRQFFFFHRRGSVDLASMRYFVPCVVYMSVRECTDCDECAVRDSSLAGEGAKRGLPKKCSGPGTSNAATPEPGEECWVLECYGDARVNWADDLDFVDAHSSTRSGPPMSRLKDGHR